MVFSVGWSTWKQVWGGTEGACAVMGQVLYLRVQDEVSSTVCQGWLAR